MSIKVPDDIEEGNKCADPECKGLMGFRPVENCSCHINPPCGACTDNPLVCLECGLQIGDSIP